MQAYLIGCRIMQRRHEPGVIRNIDTFRTQALPHLRLVGYLRKNPCAHQTVTAAAGSAVERRFVRVVFRAAAMTDQQNEAGEFPGQPD